MVKRDRTWDKVEALIRAQGFACVDEDAPVVSMKYRKDVDGLQVVIEPTFTDRGRGRLRFVFAAVAVHEGERHLSGFAWCPGQQLSQAMNEALQRQIERAQGELHLAEERLAAIVRDSQLCRGLAGRVQRLTYGTTTEQGQ